MKKKVTVISNGLSGKGGTETVLSHLGNSESINAVFELDLFIFSKVRYSKWLKSCGYNRVYSTKMNSKILRLIKLILFLIKFNGEALIVTDQKILPVTSIIKSVFHKKYEVIFWSHYALDNDTLKDNENGVYIDFGKIKKADYFFAISTGIKRELIAAGVSPNKIKVIYNPISKKQKTIFPDKNECKFIYIARIQLKGQKNFGGLLDCLKKLPGNWSLDVYGAGDDLFKAEKFVESNDNLRNKVNFKGWIDNPWPKIKEANALLLNSEFEGLPMVLAEALSYGIPVVSSDCPTGPEDLVKSGENGYLYKVRDYQELLVILEKFVDKNISFNIDTIKNSVSFMYNSNYDKRFIKNINDIIK
ncbi:glycosyltransferase [Fructilactobacillus lindneri]|uniref:glycosyltransferase n=1 Tax=Fructilactobacillus lindneri TaxID=53444 RepID=UPI00081A6E40|nr:glycosyltransferase [Fructilactobacillus lindneri]ANZ57750.1 hypothetical protein AYR60_02715 [Fructilactobacillus lindneri]